MYATNPVYRWQNHGEFNLLFNALMNWDDLGVNAGEKPVSQDGAQHQE